MTRRGALLFGLLSGPVWAGCPAAPQTAEPTPTPPANASPAAPVQDAASWSQRLEALRVDVLDADRDVATQDAPLSALLPPGQAGVLSFFATYCPPCIEEMPDLVALAAEGHRIAGVSLDTGNLEAVRTLLDEQKVRYPVGVVTRATLKGTGQALDGLPLTLVLDERGRVTRVFRGRARRPALLDALGVTR